MKKFVFLAHGEMERTPEFQQAHRAWWSSMEGHVVDSGNPLFNGRDVAKDGSVSELSADAVVGARLLHRPGRVDRRSGCIAGRVPDGHVGLRGNADVTSRPR